jgi:phage shock protein A
MSQKTIRLNPEFLSGGTTKKDTRRNEKREKKIRASSLVKPNKLKKQLLDKIKNHQKRTEEIKDNISITDEFSNDFNKSVDYLEQMVKKREKQKKK